MRTSKETPYSLVNEKDSLPVFFLFFFIKNSAEGKFPGLLLTLNPEQCLLVNVTVKWILFDSILRCKLKVVLYKKKSIFAQNVSFWKSGES